MTAPVMVCGFKRAECLERVLAAVREAKVRKLYLVLDAPREGRSDDLPGYEKCKRLFDEVDWSWCEVKRNYADRNMGCGARMTSGISWVFEHEDRAIILEDDCVPDLTFFQFCDELLEKYKDDARVGMIAGHDEHLHLDRINSHGDSYYFDRMCCIWGWATWRRAWCLHDPDLPYFPAMAESDVMLNVLGKRRYVKRWRDIGERLYSKKQKTWAGAWAMTMYKENMLSIHPYCNLVTNIGCACSSRACGVPTKTFRSPYDNRPTRPMSFPLKHPVTMIPNVISERYFLSDNVYATYLTKILRDPVTALRRLAAIFR